MNQQYIALKLRILFKDSEAKLFEESNLPLYTVYTIYKIQGHFLQLVNYKFS